MNRVLSFFFVLGLMLSVCAMLPVADSMHRVMVAKIFTPFINLLSISSECQDTMKR